MELEYRDYLADQARAAWNLATERAALVFAFAWNELRSRFAGFWFTAPLFWLSIFWVIDFILGSGRAISEGQWKPRRALLSSVKLAAGCVGLLVAHALRDTHLLFSSIPANLLETVILFAEISSVLIHVGEITGIKALTMIGRAFRSGSDRAAKKLTKMIDPDQKEENDEPTKHAIPGPDHGPIHLPGSERAADPDPSRGPGGPGLPG